MAAKDAFPELYLAGGLVNLAEAQRLTDFNAVLNEMSPPVVETVGWESDEGDTIEGMLYWPPGQQGRSGLPLVVDIHGGPDWAKTEALVFNLPVSYAYYPALL